jgi:glutamate---cysteine ligase / carboxylate-amine ligase
MPIEFKEGNSGYTLGVEEELSIVDATTGELVPKIEEIMGRLPEGLGKFVSYELFQSVLEIKTPICASVAETEKHLRELRGRVGSWAGPRSPPWAPTPFPATATRRSPTRSVTRTS